MRIDRKREVNNRSEGSKCHEVPRYKTRVLTVDMMRIEDAYDIGPLTEFEREVKEKMAVAPSPYLLLEKAEEEQELESRKVQLRELAREAELTPRQRECFHLLCEEDCGVAETAQRMGLSERRILEIQGQMAVRMKKHRKFVEMKRAAEKVLETEAQAIQPLHIEVLCLRYRDRLSSQEIALRLGKNRLAIDRILKLFSPFEG